MNFVNDILGGKRWLFYGSIMGGLIGALLILLNQLMPQEGQIVLGLKMGPVLTTALGMIGGILGGVIGSLLSGFFSGEDVFMNIGGSLGIGLTNGFLSGTTIGLAAGLINRWKPHLITPKSILIIIAILAAVALISHFFRRRAHKEQN